MILPDGRVLLIEQFHDVKWDLLGETKIQESKLPRAILEASDGKKALVVRGRFQYADKLNQNNRMYPLALIKRETAKLQPLVEKRGLLGECDHPEILETSLGNVSHVITKLWMEGKEQLGELEILPTPAGNIIRNLYESNVAVGISSRGAGRSEQKDGYQLILDDFSLKTYDLVDSPSTHGAYPTLTNEKNVNKDLIELHLESARLHQQLLCGLG